MNKKKKRIAYLIIILVGIVSFGLFILFLGNDERFDFVPFVIGSAVAFACFAVKHTGVKPIEWKGNVKKKDLQESQENNTEDG